MGLNLTKAYLNREVSFHFHLGISHSENYCILLQRAYVGEYVSAGDETAESIIEAADPPPDDARNGHVEMTVFINVIEAVKPPKVVESRIPSRAWLQTLDDCCGGGSNAFEEGLSLVLELTVTPRDGEGVISRGSLSVRQNQLPDKVVKSRPQVVDDFSESDRPLDWSAWRLSSEYPDLLPSVFMHLVGNELLLGLRELSGISPEYLAFLYSAIELGIDSHEGGHDSYYPHEHQYSEDTKDLKGVARHPSQRRTRS